METMRKHRILIALLLPLAVAACARGGLNKRGPDELAIARNAPLVVPQDYSLVPPKPGAPRAATIDAQAAAMEALFGPGVKPPPKSPAEQQLLDRAGANNPEPGIRSQAGDPRTTTVNKGAFLREVLDAPAATRDAALAEAKIPQ
jgi:hypothetical protein